MAQHGDRGDRGDARGVSTQARNRERRSSQT